MKATHEKPHNNIAYKRKKRQNSFSPGLDKKQNKTQEYSKWEVLVMGQVGNKFRHTYVLTQTLYLYWIYIPLFPPSPASTEP